MDKDINILSKWDNLESAEKDQYTRVVRYLIEHTFILNRQYGTSESGQKGLIWNADYVFALSEFDTICNYFIPLGFELKKEEKDGIIFLDKTDEEIADIPWDSVLILYALRILYDERLPMIFDVLKNVPIYVDELLEVLERFNKDFINKTGMPLKGRLRKALSIPLKHNIVTKIDSGEISNNTRLLIHPTITIVLDSDRIRALSACLVKSDVEEGDDDENT